MATVEEIRKVFSTYFTPDYTGQLDEDLIQKILKLYEDEKLGSNKISERLLKENNLNINQGVIGRILTKARKSKIVKTIPKKELAATVEQVVQGENRKISNVIREVTALDRKQNPNIPKDAKYKIVFATPQGKTTKIPEEFRGVKYFNTKTQADAALDKRLKADFKTPEDPTAAKLKRQRTRAENIKAVTKGSSPADKAAVNVVEDNIKKINKYFKNDPDKINNTAFGRNIKKMMALRLDKESGKLVVKLQSDDYYKNKAAQGQLFDLFDVNPVAGKKRGGRFVTNLNISPNVFNRAFIGSQLTNYFKRDKIDPNVTNELDRILKSLNIKVDLPTVGKVGATGADVAFDSKTGSFPRILKTLENLEAPDEIKDLFKSTKLKTIKDLSPDLKFASEIDRPEKALLKEDFKAFSSRLKNYDNLDPTTYPSKTYVRSELKKVPVEAPVNQAIKDFDIPKGTILKGLAKGTLRAVAPFVPFVGALGVALGVSDVAKAKDEGLEGEELGIAYLVGPELAKKYSDFKDRNLNVETESEGIMGLRNGGRVGFQGGGMDASQDDFSGGGKSKGRQDPMGGREDFTAAEIRAADPIGYGGGLTGPGFQDRDDQPPTNIPPPPKDGTIPITINLGSDSVLGFDVPSFVDFSLPTKYGLFNLRQRFSDFINPDEIDLNPELTFGGSVPLFGGDLRFGIGATKEGLMKDPSPFITFSKVLGGDKRR